MIVVELAGGLGNQMFQYAYGRALALKNKTELVFDHRFIERRDIKGDFTYRDYELNIFNIQARKLKAEEYQAADRLKNKWNSKLFRKALPAFSAYVQEDQARYRSSYLSVKAPAYITGYFQNPKYFAGSAKEIRAEFGFKPDLSAPARQALDMIRGLQNPVSLHIRRGDYLHRPDLQNICDDQYYQAAIKHIKSQHPDIEVVAFSDDPDWVRGHFTVPGVQVHVVNSREAGFKNYEDLRLMAQCHHHIIANSSFSWWGAWLGKNPEKVVCAPPKWDRKRLSANIVDTTWHIVER